MATDDIKNSRVFTDLYIQACKSFIALATGCMIWAEFDQTRIGCSASKNVLRVIPVLELKNPTKTWPNGDTLVSRYERLTKRAIVVGAVAGGVAAEVEAGRSSHETWNQGGQVNSGGHGFKSRLLR